MKVSEAMRAGEALLSEAQPRMTQIHDSYARDGEGACAAGMAFLGNGTPFARLAAFDFDEVEEFPELGEQVPFALLPESYQTWLGTPNDPALLSVVIKLNDPPFNWTVGDIINWVEGIGR